MTFLEIFSSKKFSRVVVYCSVIKVPVVLSQATALIFYQIRSALSRTFLFSCFALPLSFRSASGDSLYNLSHQQSVVNSFFHLFFQRFRFPFLRSHIPGCSASASPADMTSAAFQGPVISDRCYLITAGSNCQCFFSFLFISDNSSNSDRSQTKAQLYLKQNFSINTLWNKSVFQFTLWNHNQSVSL